MLTLAVRDLEPGEAVLMTTYRSYGQTVATGEPFLEARTTAADQSHLPNCAWRRPSSSRAGWPTPPPPPGGCSGVTNPGQRSAGPRGRCHAGETVRRDGTNG
ncbi:hypothetical protein [Streptomyces buecherae]|uniref:hypothetical protein n=1 Tax=Streptomyces buecherae TaxID=2763006 RepID=UPI0036C0F538